MKDTYWLIPASLLLLVGAGLDCGPTPSTSE